MLKILQIEIIPEEEEATSVTTINASPTLADKEYMRILNSTNENEEEISLSDDDEQQIVEPPPKKRKLENKKTIQEIQKEVKTESVALTNMSKTMLSFQETALSLQKEAIENNSRDNKAFLELLNKFTVLNEKILEAYCANLSQNK